jgi:hypothetical protein
MGHPIKGSARLSTCVIQIKMASNCIKRRFRSWGIVLVLVVVLVLIVAPKLFIKPGAKATLANAFEREQPPDCE